MRIGQNPAKKAPAGHRARSVTACTIVYIPREDGFWQGSFEVLQASLMTLHRTAGDELDLFVLDNGSCERVSGYLANLLEQGVITCLLTARANLGKAGGWNVLLPACPGRHIVYFDSDILFRPGWLRESLKIAGAFDRAGMVTARPSRTSPRIKEDLLSATFRYAEGQGAGVSARRGDLIPREVVQEFARSIGKEDDPMFDGPGDDLLLERDDVSAFAYSGHYQFLTTREVIARVLPLEEGRALGGVRAFDLRVNELGYLRLATPIALVHHLGNSISPEERQEIDSILGAAAPPRPAAAAGNPQEGLEAVFRGLARCRRVRRALERIYLRLHAALH